MKLQKLGLEIRRTGHVNNLYQDVDLILNNYNVPQSSINTDVQVSTVAHALQKMMKTEKWFDVCTIKNCSSLCQICIPEERMQVYQSIHCMSWSEMLPDYRQLIIAMVLDDFRDVLNP